MRTGLAAVFVVLLGGLLACGGGPADPVAAGRRVYVANCTTCHSDDPTRAGTMGPPVAGASRELIEARVLRGEYPPGYTPKRDTALMPPMPYLSGEIDALTAYLNSF